MQNKEVKLVLYLVELVQNDCLEAIIIHFLADRGQVVLQNRNIQAEIKLRQVVAKREGLVTYSHLSDVAHSAAFENERSDKSRFYGIISKKY